MDMCVNIPSWFVILWCQQVECGRQWSADKDWYQLTLPLRRCRTQICEDSRRADGKFIHENRVLKAQWICWCSDLRASVVMFWKPTSLSIQDLDSLVILTYLILLVFMNAHRCLKPFPFSPSSCIISSFQSCWLAWVVDRSRSSCLRTLLLYYWAQTHWRRFQQGRRSSTIYVRRRQWR